MTDKANYYIPKWLHVAAIDSAEWVCWRCGAQTGGNIGYAAQTLNPRLGRNGNPVQIYICPRCGAPAFFDEERVVHPSAPYGASVDHLPSEVSLVYEEARRVFQVNAHLAAMLCRKLIMSIAVAQGGKPDKTFAFYVDFLVDNGYIPHAAKSYATRIKDLGNDANHEIRSFTRDEAAEMMSFLEMLCKTTYEYPGRLRIEAAATV